MLYIRDPISLRPKKGNKIQVVQISATAMETRRTLQLKHGLCVLASRLDHAKSKKGEQRTNRADFALGLSVMETQPWRALV